MLSNVIVNLIFLLLQWHTNCYYIGGIHFFSIMVYYHVICYRPTVNLIRCNGKYLVGVY